MSQLGSTLGTAIETAASGGIKRASGDEGSVETHSIPDLIEADKYLATKNTGAKPLRRMIRRVIMRSPGANGPVDGVSQ